MRVRNSHTILAVDDNDQLLQVVCRQFEISGFTVIASESGDAAIELLHSGIAPHVLVTDAIMPGEVQGWDLARYSKSLLPSTPVLMMSGHIGPDDANVARIPAIDVFLNKPFALSALLAQVKLLLERSTLGAQDPIINKRDLSLLERAISDVQPSSSLWPLIAQRAALRNG